MSRIYSFPPVSNTDTRVLILGSMPGVKSLNANQYYAHAQNAFWKIMGELIGADRDMEYLQRLERLKAHGIGLWDSLHSCRRAGALDSAIEWETIIPNDFSTFFATHSQVTHIFFNGGTAAAVYKRHVLPALSPDYAYVQYEQLPSTSPAHASLNFEQKLQRWKTIVL